MMRGSQRFLSLLMGVVLIGSFIPTSASAGNNQYFPEMKQVSSNAFYDFWLAHGQTEILGLPLSPVVLVSGVGVIQFYERAIMEWHPENTRENRVLLMRLGSINLDSEKPSGDTSTLQLRTTPPRHCDTSSNCETFSATSHTLLSVFRDYWYSHGGLATFGYPLTEELQVYHQDSRDMLFQSQYFERAVFEWHPEIGDGTVLLSRLGAGIFAVSQSAIAASKIVQVPDYDSSAPFLAAT